MTPAFILCSVIGFILILIAGAFIQFLGYGLGFLVFAVLFTIVNMKIILK